MDLFSIIATVAAISFAGISFFLFASHKKAAAISGVLKRENEKLNAELGEKERTIGIMHARSEALLASIDIGVAVADTDGKFIAFNSAAERIIGQGAVNAPLSEWPKIYGLLEPKTRKPFLPDELPLVKALRGETPASPTEMLVQNPLLNREVYITVNAWPVRSSDGTLLGGIITFRDITAARGVDRLKSEFISTASHQLRTPLTAIKWVVERIIKTQKLSLEATEYLGDIHTSTQRLSDLVDILLNVSRIEGGSVGIAPQTLDVVQFVKSYFSECMPLAAKKQISLKLTKYPRELPVKTDVGAFRNIVQSLVSNAIEYTPEKGTIEISIEKKASSFVVLVKDSGIGIPKGERDKIFEKFYRAENAKLVKTDGTGLGLYIAREATELLGGRIWFESPVMLVKNESGKEMAKGTAFFVELPVETKPRSGEKRFS